MKTSTTLSKAPLNANIVKLFLAPVGLTLRVGLSRESAFEFSLPRGQPPAGVDTDVTIWGELLPAYPVQVTYSADMLITNMVNAVENLGVDGVDIANEEGCGYANLNCGDQTTLQLYVVDQLRRRMPDKVSTEQVHTEAHRTSAGVTI